MDKHDNARHLGEGCKESLAWRRSSASSVEGLMVAVVLCFHDHKFRLSSQLKAASCAWCNYEMPPSKQVNGHSFTICLIVWCSPQSQSGEAM